MIRYFPNIFTDELLYSAFCRYYEDTEQESHKTALKELLSKGNPLAIIQFPSNIELFIEQFNGISYYSAEDIIFKFTMLPLCYPFLDVERQEYAINNMKGNNGKGIYMKLGIMASNLKALRFLKYCPECLKEDKGKYGEVYWHRSHNVVGVHLCHKHNRVLEQFCHICNTPIATKNKFKLTPLRTECDNGHDITNQGLIVKNRIRYVEEHKKISKAVEFLLNSDLRSFNIEKVFNRYINLLGQKGFLTISGRFKMKELKEQFLNYYKEGFLQDLNLSIDLYSNCSWLEELLHKRKKMTHPIKHILLINFLVDDFKEFFYGGDKDLNLFGVGPWPCLNPVAEHFKQSVVSKCIITKCTHTKKPVGTFICDCGFIYSRKGPDTEPCHRYKIGTIKKFGHVWEEKLKNVLNEGGSLRSMAKKMKVDPMTVKKYSAILKDDNTSNNTTFQRTNVNFKISEKYANNIKSFMSTHEKKITRTELRKVFQKEYIWLYRHNNDLLQEILPPNSIRNKTNNVRVNWDERDINICGAISSDIEKLLRLDKIVRITLSKVGTDTGTLSILEQHLNKLPKTKEIIEQFKESIEDFQIRRVRKVVNDLIKNGDDISEWKIYRKAGIRKDCSEKVKNEIQLSISNSFKNIM
ncbi:TnsD family Tn7-like transposition protein [Clostridium sp. BSD9I1]|uniref:TnsD family Tn7-like transposition protein n=1 Tax=Clostridium sp. BSD9I1 TaxID=2003589 RepID=UPI00164506CB|nr:TnsD family Tn7-like transposition protein [Clostridium sp. BSD9I1]